MSLEPPPAQRGAVEGEERQSASRERRTLYSNQLPDGVKDLLREAEERQWTVLEDDDAAGEVEIDCPCPMEHFLVISPGTGGAYRLGNTRQYLERSTCWGEGGLG